MRLAAVTTPNVLFPKSAEQTFRLQPGQVFQAQILEDAHGNLMLQVNQNVMTFTTLIPLAPGSVSLQVLETDGERVVLKLVNAPYPTTSNDVSELIHSMGLTVNDQRCSLVKELLSSGEPVEREMVLLVEKLMQAIDGEPLNAVVLTHMVKAKLPLDETTALAIGHWETGREGDSQPYYYLRVDLQTLPPQCSWHLVDPDGRENTSQPDSSSRRPILIGCSTDHLGPVLVVINDGSSQVDVRFLVMDSERQVFVTQELSELRQRLVSFARHLQLAVGTMGIPEPDHGGIAIPLTHLNIRI